MELYTIGYEGLDQAHFLSWLIDYDVSIVADVRKLPLSRKKGFSKNSLIDMLSQQAIEYLNFRELGAPKELRIELKESQNFPQFFRKYQIELEKNLNSVDQILSMVRDGERVLLLCYEKNPNTCHRKAIADEVKKRDGNGTMVKHLGFHYS